MRITQERNSFLHDHLTDALDANKDIWKEMRNLGLLRKRKEENLHGFTPEELNAHFAGIFVSPFENIEEAMDIILPANEEGFQFKPVDFNTVVLLFLTFPRRQRE